jgi:hypothetical protein
VPSQGVRESEKVQKMQQTTEPASLQSVLVEVARSASLRMQRAQVKEMLARAKQTPARAKQKPAAPQVRPAAKGKVLLLLLLPAAASSVVAAGGEVVLAGPAAAVEVEGVVAVAAATVAADAPPPAPPAPAHQPHPHSPPRAEGLESLSARRAPALKRVCECNTRLRLQQRQQHSLAHSANEENEQGNVQMRLVSCKDLHLLMINTQGSHVSPNPIFFSAVFFLRG